MLYPDWLATGSSSRHADSQYEVTPGTNGSRRTQPTLRQAAAMIASCRSRRRIPVGSINNPSTVITPQPNVAPSEQPLRRLLDLHRGKRHWC